MRILITGATGLVGSSLVARCRQEGIEVHYLSTRPDQLKSEAGYRGFLWDPAAGKIDPECFRGVQMIVNLAGSPMSQPWTASRKKKSRSSRVDSLYCLQKALKSLDSHQVEYLVSASAIGLSWFIVGRQAETGARSGASPRSTASTRSRLESDGILAQPSSGQMEAS